MLNKTKFTSVVLSCCMAATVLLPSVAFGYTPQYSAKAKAPVKSQYVPPKVYNGYQQSFAPLQGRVVTVPAGTIMYATSGDTIGTDSLTIGDTVEFNLGSPLYFNNSQVVPAGSVVQGNVVIANRAGLAGKNAKLKIKFTNIITTSGQRIPISGKISTPDETGILVGGTSKARIADAAKETAKNAAIGAIFGTAIGAIAGGKPGRGAWSGTAVGAGVGATKAIIDKGNEVIIPAGSQVDILLDQPFTATPSSY